MFQTKDEPSAGQEYQVERIANISILSDIRKLSIMDSLDGWDALASNKVISVDLPSGTAEKFF
jgi:hypothetical protein